MQSTMGRFLRILTLMTLTENLCAVGR